MPIIRHETGPLAGKVQTLDDSLNRITFGRDPSACDVVFPADNNIVARRHFALVRTPAGEWIFEGFGKPYVAINGTTAEAAQAVSSGGIIELGQSGGPSFEFITGGKNLGDDQLATMAQQTVESSHKTSARARRMAMLAVFAAVLVGGGAAGYSYWSARGGAALEKKFTDLAEAQAKQAADSIGPAVRDKLVQQAHLVMKVSANNQFIGGGTAFPVASDLLGTNAHVAEIFSNRKPGEKVLIRAPGPNGKVHEIKEVIIHPGWDAFRKYTTEDPIYVTATRDCVTCGATPLSAFPSYDVALIRVAPDANLGPIVEIASRKTLEELKPGMAVGVAGFPLEKILNAHILGTAATPNLRVGMINSLTDFFSLPGDNRHRHLVTHNVPIAGGNSGSAMVGSDGKLLALVNAGNMTSSGDGSRTPSGAIINYGQRADMLLDLMEGKAEAALKDARAYWNRQTANFARGSEYVIPNFIEMVKAELKVSPQKVAEFKGKLTGADSYKTKENDQEVVRRQKIHKVDLKANTSGFLLAYGFGKGLRLYVVNAEGKIVAQDEVRPSQPFVLYPNLPNDISADVYLVGLDSDADYVLVHYNWTGGQS